MATIELYDRVRETTTTTGTGSVTLAGAVTGYRTFQSVLSTNDVTYYCIQNQSVPSEWEVGFGTLSASTTLARTSVTASSNSGNLVNFSAGTKDVFITFPAEACAPVDSGVCELRLTLTSNTPVTSSDVTAASTLYLTPYLGNRISLYTGNRWKLYSTAEVSLALSSLTSDKNYDVWATDSGGAVALSLSSAWTNDTTRAQSLSRVDGVLVRSDNTALRYLGTIRTTGTTTTEDSAVKRFVWNNYNRVCKMMNKFENTFASGYTYSTASYRVVNNDSANLLQIVQGQIAEAYHIKGRLASTSSGVTERYHGIGLDSTTANSAQHQGYASVAAIAQMDAFLVTILGTPGYHYFSALEYGSGAGTQTWYTATGSILEGLVWC